MMVAWLKFVIVKYKVCRDPRYINKEPVKLTDNFYIQNEKYGRKK
jgi:hypothetical protein